MMEMIRKIKRIYVIYIRKYWFAIIGVFIMLAFATAFGFVENLLNQYLLDVIISSRHYERLAPFVCVYVGVNLICLILSFLIGRQNLSVSQKCSIDMRIDLMARIHLKDMSEMNVRKSSEFVVRMMEDVTIVSGFFNNVIIGNIATVLTIFIMMGYMFHYSRVIAVVVFFVSIFQIIIASFFSNSLKCNQEVIRKVTQEHMGQLEDNISNLPLIKAYMLGSFMLGNYKKILKSIYRISKKNYDTEYLLNFFTTMIAILCDVFVVFVGVTEIKNGVITIGAFVIILNISVSIRSLFMTLAGSNAYFQQFFVSLNRVFEIIEMKEDVVLEGAQLAKNHVANEMKLVLSEPIKDVSFRGVSFSYGVGKSILNEFDMNLKNGQINVLTGESGGGKSTIIGLLLQLYYPTAGEIFVNGQRLSGTETMRKQVAVCFQTDYFIHGSIYDNLKSANLIRTDEEIDNILHLVEAHEFIRKLPKGLNSSIGEISKNFSGGELKRISLARTLLKDAQIYVFDESFANIDAEMRSRIFQNIVAYLEGKIILVVTHDQTLTDGYDAVQITV